MWNYLAWSLRWWNTLLSEIVSSIIESKQIKELSRVRNACHELIPSKHFLNAIFTITFTMTECKINVKFIKQNISLIIWCGNDDDDDDEEEESERERAVRNHFQLMTIQMWFFYHCVYIYAWVVCHFPGENSSPLTNHRSEKWRLVVLHTH